MIAQLAEKVTEKPSAQDLWSDHVQGAVMKFLKTAVVIDNQPYVKKRTSTPPVPAPAQVDSGMGDEVTTLTIPASATTQSAGAHDLDIRKISDVFAESGVACAFVLPDDDDTNVEEIKRRILSATKPSDIVVIDWYLRPQDSSLTLQLLQEIAESDQTENGRMRLLCVYTGEGLDNGIFNDVKGYLSAGGLTLKDVPGIEFCAKNENFLVVLLNKSIVPAEILPLKLIKLFSCLADGLIPAFALAAIGAIRKNTHHMLTRFGRNLDPAYIANRLITNPPGDVAELMRELLVSECDNALGLDSIADDFLEEKTISKWLDNKELKGLSYDIGQGEGKKTISIDRAAVDGLLKFGIGDNDFKLDEQTTVSFPEKHRSKVSHLLSGTTQSSHESENEFARLVVFRREAFGFSTPLGDSWKPSLTTGTLLRVKDGQQIKYLMCFTPACDTLRLDKARPFVFVEGEQSKKPYSVVVTEEDGSTVGLHFDKNYPKVSTYSFPPDAKTQRVRGKKADTNPKAFIFKSLETPDFDFLWLGEIRYGRAMSEMTSIANRWMRVGILDSEHLRLASRKNFDFKS
ncbi:hypothetical protein J3P88_28420 [Pseudomonas sp. Z3-6]|uniref:response regulator receiver domain n=1 Tax=Pseudomonas sp. Z3-6 TaxID=2817411 RepID=UPI003DA9704E